MPSPSYLQRIARQFGDHAPVLLPVRPLFGRGLTDGSPPVTGERVAVEPDSQPAVAPIFPGHEPTAHRSMAIEPGEQPAVAPVRHEPEPEFSLVTTPNPVMSPAGISYDAPVASAVADGRFKANPAVSLGLPPRVASERPLKSEPAPMPARQVVSAPAETEGVARQTPSPHQQIQRTAEFETAAAVPSVRFDPIGETPEHQRPLVESTESNARLIAPLQLADRNVFAERVSPLPGIEPVPPVLETTVTVPPAPVSPAREPLESRPAPLQPQQVSAPPPSPAGARILPAGPPVWTSPDSVSPAASINPAGEPLPAERRLPPRVEPNPPAQSPPPASVPETRYRVTLEPKPPTAPATTARTLGPSALPPGVQQPERSPRASVQIGSLDIHITPVTPPRPAPVARQATPSASLARGFTSPFGLRQG